MERNEIATQLTWDLTSLFKDQSAFEKQYAKAVAVLETLQTYKGSVSKDIETFITFLNQQEELERYLENLLVFAKMATDVEPEDTLAQQNLASASTLVQKATIELTFVSQEIIAHKESIHTYLQDERCVDFRYAMDEIFRTIPHRLDDRSEDLLAQVEEISSIPEDTFQSFRLEYPDVMVDGKPEFLNGATLSQFYKHANPQVRKDAFEHYFGEYKRYQNVFNNLLVGHAKGQVLRAKARNFPSALEASLFEDGVSKDLYEKVLAMANEKYRSYVHAYFALRKDILQLDTQHVYDMNLPLVDSVDVSYSIDDSFAILDKALAPLGNDYLRLLRKARDERWIDFMPCAGKRTGAYSWGSYDSLPFILTNFNADYESLSTLAHELGHSMHSYYSRKHNRPFNAGYKIFVAEVASTVNEILLNTYLLKTSKDDNYKAYILSNLLTQLTGTLYRQPMFAQFESHLHEEVEKRVALSSSDLTKYYYDLNKSYFGDSVEVDDLQRYGCYYIPHFYYNFYVYKYTLGMSVALSFVKRILAGDVQDYLTFLTKGGSESPLDELIHAGCDPRQDNVYDDAFAFFKETLDEFQSLMKK